jgi:cytochrome c-type biogenesis protein CcmH
LRIVLLFFCLVLSADVFAQTQDIYQFESLQKRVQFDGLLQQLRCLVCQNQNLAESDADLAKDLRAQVYEMIQSDRSDHQIRGFLLQRYGDFILFKPRMDKHTLLLWAFPFVTLILALFILYFLIWSRNNRRAH